MSARKPRATKVKPKLTSRSEGNSRTDDYVHTALDLDQRDTIDLALDRIRALATSALVMAVHSLENEDEHIGIVMRLALDQVAEIEDALKLADEYREKGAAQ